ncbi:MAG: glycoside hydrolase family 78 protein [Bacteroidales bacterium]|nr:glycoside hydrolase family 78 protein [Bacteroidales bacterium]
MKRNNISALLTLPIVAMLAAACGGEKVKLVSPTVEQQTKPMALATAEPRFSWKYEAKVNDVHQVAYRIVVATTEDKAKQGEADLWDSQLQASSQMAYIPYAGTALHSRDKAYWKVYSTLVYGPAADTLRLESSVQSFEISLLAPSDWQAQWIGHDFDDDVLVEHTRVAARYLRKAFTLDRKVASARIYIAGLGSYSLYLNGTEVAPEELLKPALSDYRKRVYVNTYDVTSLLAQGDNAIGVTLAGGRFTAMRQREGGYPPNTMVHFGTPRLIAQLEITFADGTTQTIATDPTWKITNRGPIRTSNEFDGETYDARMELTGWNQASYNDADWLQAEAIEASLGSLEAQSNPNIEVQDHLTPIALFQKDGKWYLDMGQNMVGYLNIKFKGQQPGDTLTLRFAETLTPDSLLYMDNIRSAEVTDRYIAATANGQWHPMFVYHGFRFVEISGLRTTPKPADFEGLVFYDRMTTTGTFQSSNEVVNAIYRNAYWGIRGNYRSMPTDCPQRDERMGWLGDRTTGSLGESYMFGNHQLYAKWLTDIADCQLESGAVCDVAPAYWPIYSNSMTWPGTFIAVADMLYTRFGDSRPIQRHYTAMKRWLDFMADRYMKDDLLMKDTYGDWCMPPESLELIHSRDTNRITKAPVISTPHYCYLASRMAAFADMLGQADDARRYREQAARSAEAFNARYFNQQEGRYDNNTVTANILPIAFGLVPEGSTDAVFANIVDKTENECGGHVSTGVIGIQHLMRTLTEHGRGDLALRLASDTTYPSWGYMQRQGATTIWELWNGNTANPAMNSGNHVMLLGDLLVWEYEYLAGIRPLAPGYTQIALKPYPIEGLDHVSASYESVAGTIRSEWTRKGNRFEWTFTIPANTTAEVSLPSASGYTTQTLGSGTYHMESTL